MEDREWMYMLRRDEKGYDLLFIVKVKEFLKHAFGKSVEGHSLVVCPCSGCDNRRRKDRTTMGKHIVKFGFTPGYYRWIHHGEADRIREEVVRPRLKDFEGWSIMHQVSLHGKLPVPNDEDYIFDTNTYDRVLSSRWATMEV
jgi:hypothetical protein